MQFDLPACLLAAADLHESLVPLWVMEWAADLFLGLWLFFLGSTVGSFLNVVVYRLPRGINLAYPGSRCPACLHPIRLSNNIPVLSWLLLGGKCRDCKSPISSRYFLIELLLGSVFVGTWLVESNFSRDLFVFGAESIRPTLNYFNFEAFWCAYGLHVALFATVLGGALIHGDRFRTPPALFLPILIAGFALPLVWPEIRRLPAWNYGHVEPWRAGLIDGLAGLAAGVLIALLGSGRWLVFRRQWPPFAPLSLMASLGIVLGWQRMLLVAPAVVLLYVAAAAMLWLLGPLPSMPDPPAEPIALPASDSSSPPLPADPDFIP